MAQSALAATRVESVGSFTREMRGNAGGASTSTVVTLPANLTVISGSVMVSGATSSTAPYCDTVSANTFTVTHASADRFSWSCLVKGGI